MPHNGLSDRQYSKVAIDPRPSTSTVARLSNETFVTDKTSDALIQPCNDPACLPSVSRAERSNLEVTYETPFASSQALGTMVTTGEETSDTAPTQQKTAVISILLVDDHALMREGLKQLLELEQDLHVVGEAVDGFDALDKIRQLHPNIVLMDISMPMI